MRLTLLSIASLLVCAGCMSNNATETVKTPTQSAPTPEAGPAGPWVLSSHGISPGPALLWNGLLGVRIAPNGSGLDLTGKPLGFFLIDAYDQKGAQAIQALPNPILVTWAVGNSLWTPDKKKSHDFLESGGTPLDPRKATDYTQELDMRTGVLHTEWSQTFGQGAKATLACDTVVHPTQRVIAQRWTLTTSSATPFTVRTLDYAGPTDPQATVGSNDAKGFTISASSKRIVTMKIGLTGGDVGALGRVSGFRIQEGTTGANKPLIYDRILNFSKTQSVPKFTSSNFAQMMKLAPPPATFDDVKSAAARFWAERWKTDIVIDGPMSDQQAVHSFMFYLSSAVSPDGGMGVSPFALSDAQYNGHVFWDADIWVFPALALIDPDAARAIPAYRLSKAKAASYNFRNWWIAKNKAQGRSIVPPGLKYPWESSVDGTETAPGSSSNEEHITGSVMWGLTQALRLGLAPQSVVQIAAAMANSYYQSRSTRLPGGKLSLDGVMSPDENHTGNNDLYTNLLAQWLSDGRRWQDHPANGPGYLIPHDSNGLLTYDGDAMRSYKQAAAILSIYPLQYPPAEATAKAMMGRFADKVIPNGPAMSGSIDALIDARLGESDLAYKTWLQSWQPYTANPFLLFAEKKTKPNSYFTTGAGGCLQTVLYGFLGFRIDLKPQPGAAWSKGLLEQAVLSVKPNLPPSWKSVTFRNFTVLGARYTLKATQSGAQVAKGD